MEETNNLIFTLTAILAIAMTLIYFPLRFFLTLTARSRRLKLLQKIRRLRDELGQPYESTKLNTHTPVYTDCLPCNVISCIT